MKRSEAVEAVITMTGGVRYDPADSGGLPSFRFPGLADADRCKAILDALLAPSGTGAVFASGRLIVDLRFIDDQAAAQQAALAIRDELTTQVLAVFHHPDDPHGIVLR